MGEHMCTVDVVVREIYVGSRRRPAARRAAPLYVFAVDLGYLIDDAYKD